jgi:SAM-dependent methyltransferase
MNTMTLPVDVEQDAAVSACRFCGAGLRETFVDLGMSPLCEAYPLAIDQNRGEIYYPLHAYVCSKCFLVQLDEYETGENIFRDYLYFSSYSDSWLKHAETYCNNTASRFGLNQNTFVVEVASNDGYLLQYFVKQGVPVLGIEPAANVAQVALDRGVPTLVRFFGAELATELAGEQRRADLIVGNNVLAQVPDLNDFVEGLKILLKDEGVLTLEFPHLLQLIEKNEFDTIYHEHFSYFSLTTTIRILEAHGLTVFDVEELASHGGSLRIYANRVGNSKYPVGPRVQKVIDAEGAAHLDSLAGYRDFATRVRTTKLEFVGFLLAAAKDGKSVAGYGAPGKSATLLHYCGVGKDLISYTVDRSPHKQGRVLPGTHIPIYAPERIQEAKPDYVVILPWNLKDEIMKQLQFIRDWGGKFVVPIPEVRIF